MEAPKVGKGDSLQPEILAAVARGWRLHPIRKGTKLPCLPGWQHRASSDLKQISAWAREFPGCNWGAVAGAESGFFAVDVDDPAAMQCLEDQYGSVPEGLCNVTFQGYQLIYQWQAEADVTPATDHPRAGIDIRGRRSYIVIPPSVHPSGHAYHYTDDSLPIPACPRWLMALILGHAHADPQDRQGAPATGAPTAGELISEGSRTKHLVSLAGSMHKRGMAPAAIEAGLLAENAARCSPRLPESKVRTIAHDIPARYPNPKEEKEPRPVKPSQNGSSGGFSLVPLRELVARPDVPVDYLLAGRLVCGTVSVVVAKPKVGKSTFARNLALAVSTGRSFLGCDTLQGDVLYLALEERPEEIKADFLAMGATGDEPIHIHAADAPEAAMLELIRLLRELRPRLVVIDPLFRLARIRDEKAYAETYQALGPLIDIARETGTHILLTHHAGKTAKADAIDAPLGSTALGGIVSTLLVMKRTEGYRTLQSVQRTGAELPETVLSFDTVTRTLSLGASRAEFEQKDAETGILEYLEGKSEPQTQEQIRDNVEGQTKAIRAALTALVLFKRIRRTGEGKRGKPFFYEKQVSGSHHILGTTEPETGKKPQTRMNTGDTLVPENSGETMLVHCVCDRLWEDFDSKCGGLLQ